MFAVILTYHQPAEVVERWTVHHRTFLDNYYAKGVFVVSGRQISERGGVIIANVATRALLDAILAEDPFMIENVATYAIYEFTPTKYLQALEAIVQFPVTAEAVAVAE